MRDVIVVSSVASIETLATQHRPQLNETVNGAGEGEVVVPAVGGKGLGIEAGEVVEIALAGSVGGDHFVGEGPGEGRAIRVDEREMGGGLALYLNSEVECLRRRLDGWKRKGRGYSAVGRFCCRRRNET